MSESIILDIVPLRITDAEWREVMLDVERMRATSPDVQHAISADIALHRARCPIDAEPSDDILFAAAGVAAGRAPPAYPVPTTASNALHVHARDGIVRVLDEAPASVAQIAAAMLIEARLPKRAMVHGDIDRERAESARRWAEGVLGSERPIALPVRVDAFRLVERLGGEARGAGLVNAVVRMHLAAPDKKHAALVAIFGHAEVEASWLDKLRIASRTGSRRSFDETRAVVGAYYAATRDPCRVLGLACLDARGPRWPPDAFVEVLATLPSIESSAVERALAVVFGRGADRLFAAYAARRSVP